MTPVEMMAHVCAKAVERADALRYRGKRRDDFGMDYLIAAHATLEMTGQTEAAEHFGRVIAMIIATRGFAEVEHLARQQRGLFG